MIRTTDIFLVRAGMRGNLVGARRRASKSGSREGESREWREEEGWAMKKLRQSSFLRVDKLAISATSKELQYGMSFENEYIIRSARNWTDSMISEVNGTVRPSGGMRSTECHSSCKIIQYLLAKNNQKRTRFDKVIKKSAGVMFFASQ